VNHAGLDINADGTTVLTHGGRSELLRLFENANRVDA
jgi:hypothetical protein